MNPTSVSKSPMHDAHSHPTAANDHPTTSTRTNQPCPPTSGPVVSSDAAGPRLSSNTAPLPAQGLVHPIDNFELDTSPRLLGPHAIDEVLKAGVYIPSGDSQNVSPSGVNLDIMKETLINTALLPSTFGFLTVVCSSHIGRRKNQEDRMLLAPALMAGELAFFAIFDGTVREFASEWVHRNFLRIFYSCPSFIAFASLSKEERMDRRHQATFVRAISECYRETDRQLLEYCTLNDYPYTACTAVTVFIHIPSQTLYCAHLADSHAVIGFPFGADAPESRLSTAPSAVVDTKLIGKYLTRPHRPDDELEHRRIKNSGGQLVYLHGRKPFIRGGDFGHRKLAMQLNYSRAFGGRDLKMYGLSAEPDIRVVDIRVPSPLNPIGKRPPTDGSHDQGQDTSTDAYPGLDTRVLIIGSDGLWDVMQPDEAVRSALQTLEIYGSSLRGFTQNAQSSHPKHTEDGNGNTSNEGSADTDPTQGSATEGSGNADFYMQNFKRRPQSPAEFLVQAALENHVIRGSSDNVSCMIIYL